MTCKIAILISGRGTNMEALVHHMKSENADVAVAFVGSDNPSAHGLETARKLGIHTVTLPYDEGRAAGEHRIEELWREKGLDLLVLAGFMRLLSPDFVERHRGKILNIHPALLPKFKGAHAIEDFWKSGEEVSGVTVHVVDDKMDHGPILMQHEVRRTTGDTMESFEAKIHDVEHRIYWQALKKFIEKRAQEVRS
ncbi:MAG: phosphoribosylglycinamide formyltransferase [Pyramidobacter sp.]|jgi:phosphoribosylglycinamide formyltransferase-1